MPSNTGLYGDSDSDSISDELSPTDGYFNGRDHPQDVLIPDPSQASSESDKAREAREDAETSRASDASAAPRRDSSQHNPRSIPSRGRFNPVFEDEAHTETTPLLRPAPPAYSPPASGSTFGTPGSRSSASGNDNRSSIHNMGRPQIFLPNDGPQDLGGDPLLDGNWRRDNEGWMSQWWKWITNVIRAGTKYIVIAIALVIGIGFILSAVRPIWNHNDSSKKPITPQPGNDIEPGYGPASCHNGVHTSSASFAFANPSDFTLLQLISGQTHVRGPSWAHVKTAGEIHVRPATEPLDVAIRVNLDMYFSDQAMIMGTRFKADDDSVSLYTRSDIALDPDSSKSSHCMYLSITVWISPNTSLKHISIQTQFLSVTFHDGLSFDTDLLEVQALFNTISFPPTHSIHPTINSREIILGTTSGSITGSFPLYDLLRINTHSGTISIDVVPKNASATSPKPAVLDIHSGSGSISISTPLLTASSPHILTTIPDRDYQSSISADYGSLSLTLIHGTGTTLTTISGSISATLHPVTISSRSDISTDSGSGTTRLSVLSSPSHPSERMTKLYSSHSFLSGSLNLAYPAEWEGTLEGETLTGSISVDWPGMEITTYGGGWGSWIRKKIKGVKGDGEGVLKFKGASGSVSIKGGRGSATGGEDEAEDDGEGDGEGESGPGFGAPPRWPGYDDEWSMEGK